MPVQGALATQFAFALLAYALVAKWYVAPRLRDKPLEVVLPPLVIIHFVRPVSLWLLFPGVLVQPTIPTSFAEGTAYGDLVVAALAVETAILVRYGGATRGAVVSAWLFNIVGILDCLRNIGMGMRLGAPPHMGAMVFVVGYGVPLILVSHVLVFKVLLDARRQSRKNKKAAGASATAAS